MARNRYDEDERLNQGFKWSHFKRLRVFLAPYSKRLLIILLAIIVSNLLGLLVPYLMKIAIDTAIPSKDSRLIVGLFILFLVSAIMGLGLMRYRIYALSEVGQHLLKDMRLALFKHLQTLSFTYFDDKPHGKILIRVVNYINTLSDLLSNGLVSVLSDLLNLILTLVLMLLLDVRLTLYSLVFIPVLMVVAYIVTQKQRKAYQDLSNKQANLNAYVHESLAGIQVTQSFSQEASRFKTMQEVSHTTRSYWMKAVKLLFSLAPSVQMISTLTLALIYWVGLSQGPYKVSTGTLLAFIAYANNFWNPVINVTNFYNSLVSATAYLERIFETMDEEPSVKNKIGAIEMPEIEGAVKFDGVDFAYEPGSPILKAIDFEVSPGTQVALVGATGSGKSTLINLIPRFYDPTKGTVLIDHQPIDQVTIRSLRRQIGVMMQDSQLFSGTIRDNIRYGRLSASDREVEAAAKLVCAHPFISRLKDGYDTLITSRGSSLSAGERQLLAFARVVLADPKILILDEATANIDSQTERDIQEGLQNLLRGRTAFVVAHRLSTITSSDVIFYMSDGVILERGDHQTLMAQKGAYYQLYQTQFQSV